MTTSKIKTTVTTAMWLIVWFLISPSTLLTLKYIEVIHLPKSTVFTKVGNNISIACPGVSNGSLVNELEWVVFPKNILVIKYEESTTTIFTNPQKTSLNPETFEINFHPVSSKNSGLYICIFNSNPPQQYIHLTVQDVPDPPGRPLVTNYTSRFANLSWAPPQNTHYSHITHYVIRTRVGENGPWDVNPVILTQNNDSLFQVPGLEPFTVYSFTISAVNGMGTSPPSKESYYMVTLREVPSEKPTILMANNASATSIHISWLPPKEESIRGEFTGYRITYRTRIGMKDTLKVVLIRDPTIDGHIIQNLETYTQYFVSIQALNPAGAGPAASVYVMTDEGVPTKPVNVSVLGIGTYNLRLLWEKPVNANGLIEGYRVYYSHENHTDVQTHRLYNGEIPKIYYTLSNLSPNTEYKIWVCAYTARYQSENSEPIVNKTDISGPSAPRLLNVTCEAQESIFVQWERPYEFYENIDYYYIYVFVTGEYSYDNITLSTSKEHLETSYMIKNVTTNTLYGVRVSAASYSQYTKKLVQGEPSELRDVYVQANCDKIRSMRHSKTEFSIGMIAGLGCAIFAFVLAIVAFFVWRTCFNINYYYLDDIPCSVLTAALDWNAPADPDGEYKGPIPVNTFAKHVAELHVDGDIGFSKEYEVIQTIKQDEFPSEHSLQAENRIKNRYLNITAYDHSRVELLQMPGQKAVDYINANYIDGFQLSRAYIGTQGPLPATFNCFWRMVWEQHVTIIVMITNLVERGRRKCDMYWPKEATETYGVIQVTMVKEDVMATYTVRTLQIRHTWIKKKSPKAEKTVYQYHYTNWPDHGTPDHPLPVLHFVKKSAAANPPGSGPVIVHCSAGVGRTGTYIALDAMLKQIHARNEINIFGFLRHIRSQRNFLVQTEEQYIFIHDALLEAIESGETNIVREKIPRYVQALQTNTFEKNEPWKSLETQFKLVTSFQCKDFNLISANKSINQPKNRSNIISIENARVHLTPKPGEEGSDYINATWIQGYESLREFIITQHPLKETIKDFWQMVWDHNVQTIVMISIIDNQDFEVFWPSEEENISTDSYKVKITKEQHFSAYVSREFTMQSVQDDYELHVRMIHCANWPHHCASVAEIFHLPNTVVETNERFQNGPIIVVDRFGGPEAATYCCLSALKTQLLRENHADIYMYAKLYHIKRPGIWTSINDYLRLHLALQAFCSPPEVTIDFYPAINGIINGLTTNETVRVPPED